MTEGAKGIGIDVSYDAVPYPDYSYSESHPDRVATMATLFGMKPPPVDRCRVLELGCAGGGNLIPMAYGLPQSEFVGIDTSARQIAAGQEKISALGLKNVTLQHLDILDVNTDHGQFDYIIAHGVFSWVPPVVQDKILEISKQNLAPNGVAYVSYNVYPGWNMIGMVRGMMLYHTRKVTDPLERAAEARELLDFLTEAVSAENSGYGNYLKMYAAYLSGESDDALAKDDSSFLHDELEENNEPVYFYEFAARAARHGLLYLAETELASMVGSRFPAKVSEKLGKMARSVVDLEQYIDFVRNRTFRRTLLCHEDIALQRRLRPDVVKTFYLASNAQAVASDPDIDTVAVEEFRGSDNASLSIDHPVSKAAMLCLADVWPRALPFQPLLAAARARLDREVALEEDHGTDEPGADDVDAQVLAANMLKAYSYSESLVKLHVHVTPMVFDISERPVASPVARLQAQISDRVTNLYHQRVELDQFDRFLMGYLDGSYDRAALLEEILAGPVAQGVLTVKRTDEQVEDAQEVERLLNHELDLKLRGLARLALLVG